MLAAETYQSTQLRGAAQLIKDHIGQVRKSADGFNLNTIGIARQIIPELDKDNEIKGATFTFISNGRARSKSEMLSNLQACSDAMQMLLDGRTLCNKSVSPAWKSTARLALVKSLFGWILAKTDANQAHGRVELIQHATYMKTRTFRDASDTMPPLEKSTHDPKAREDYKGGKWRRDCKRYLENGFNTGFICDANRRGGNGKTPPQGIAEILDKVQGSIGAPQSGHGNSQEPENKRRQTPRTSETSESSKIPTPTPAPKNPLQSGQRNVR